MKKSNYKFSPSILDKFQSYLKSSEIYHQYYGFSEEPKVTEEEFEQEQFQSLINSINRVPIAWEDTEAMDRGTAFNEVVDCLIDNRKSDKMQISSNKETGTISAAYNNRTFQFPIALCKEFAEYLKGALTQQFTDGYVETKYGTVYLYGYIDQLMPFKVVDIKTTAQYNAFKYRDNWQKVVYPFCLNHNGNHINEFEFVVTDLKNSWTENYNYNEEKDLPELIEHCERFIEFLEQNKTLITNKKIYGGE